MAEVQTDYIDPEFAKTIEDRAKRKTANRAAGVRRAAETRARKQQTIDALVAALTDLASETRSACDARRFPSLTVALSEADAALALARGEG